MTCTLKDVNLSRHCLNHKHQPSFFWQIMFLKKTCQRKWVITRNNSSKQAPAVTDAPNQSINLLVPSKMLIWRLPLYSIFYPFTLSFKRLSRPEPSFILLKEYSLLLVLEYTKLGTKVKYTLFHIPKSHNQFTFLKVFFFPFILKWSQFKAARESQVKFLINERTSTQTDEGLVPIFAGKKNGF